MPEPTKSPKISLTPTEFEACRILAECATDLAGVDVDLAADVRRLLSDYVLDVTRGE